MIYRGKAWWEWFRDFSGLFFFIGDIKTNRWPKNPFPENFNKNRRGLEGLEVTLNFKFASKFLHFLSSSDFLCQMHRKDRRKTELEMSRMIHRSAHYVLLSSDFILE